MNRIARQSSIRRNKNAKQTECENGSGVPTPGVPHEGSDQARGSAGEFYTREKCYITELSNSADDPDLSIARARVAPGVTTRWHRLHGTGEHYFILQGTGRVEIGDMPPRDVTVGDIVIIPPMGRQRITNTGGSDLIFLALCTPRFKESAYEDIDDVPET